MDTALLYEQQLAEAGFVNVHVVKEKWPLNRWPKDKRYKQLGKIFLFLSSRVFILCSQIMF